MMRMGQKRRRRQGTHAAGSKVLESRLGAASSTAATAATATGDVTGAFGARGGAGGPTEVRRFPPGNAQSVSRLWGVSDLISYPLLLRNLTPAQQQAAQGRPERICCEESCCEENPARLLALPSPGLVATDKDSPAGGGANAAGCLGSGCNHGAAAPGGGDQLTQPCAEGMPGFGERRTHSELSTTDRCWTLATAAHLR